MKQSIEWHKECLENYKGSLRRKVAELQSLSTVVSRMQNEIHFYELQMILAKQHKLKSFDSDRLGKKVAAKEKRHGAA